MDFKRGEMTVEELEEKDLGEQHFLAYEDRLKQMMATNSTAFNATIGDMNGMGQTMVSEINRSTHLDFAKMA